MDLDQFAAWFDRSNPHLTMALLTAVLLVGAATIVFLVKRLLRHQLRDLGAQIGLPIETVFTITRVITGVIWAVTALLILEVWGVSVGALWAVLASAAATVIGVSFLATWTMVSNITASVYISIWRPFHLGDIVEVLPEATKGRVIDRNLMFVTLREKTGNLIQIPNYLLFQKVFRVSGGEDRSLFEALEVKAASEPAP